MTSGRRRGPAIVSSNWQVRSTRSLAEATESPAHPWDVTSCVEHDGYNERQAGDWDRTLVYNYPQTRERSLRWIAIHTVHDVAHHLLDIRRQA